MAYLCGLPTFCNIGCLVACIHLSLVFVAGFCLQIYSESSITHSLTEAPLCKNEQNEKEIMQWRLLNSRPVRYSDGLCISHPILIRQVISCLEHNRACMLFFFADSLVSQIHLATLCMASTSGNDAFFYLQPLLKQIN